MAQFLSMRPSEIRFTQDSISDEFGRNSGETLEQTFKELLYGEKSVETIRRLGVVVWGGKYWVVSGNRRLYVYKKLEQVGRLREVNVLKKPINMEKFTEMKTTKNDGLSVRIRGNGSDLDSRLNAIVSEWRRKGQPTSGRPAAYGAGPAARDDSWCTIQ